MPVAAKAISEPRAHHRRFHQGGVIVMLIVGIILIIYVKLH